MPYTRILVLIFFAFVPLGFLITSYILSRREIRRFNAAGNVDIQRRLYLERTGARVPPPRRKRW
jgi:hypothetical protein